MLLTGVFTDSDVLDLLSEVLILVPALRLRSEELCFYLVGSTFTRIGIGGTRCGGSSFAML